MFTRPADAPNPTGTVADTYPVNAYASVLPRTEYSDAAIWGDSINSASAGTVTLPPNAEIQPARSSRKTHYAPAGRTAC